MDRDLTITADTRSTEDALARIDRQIDAMDTKLQKLFGTRGQDGVFNKALPELSGFSRVLEQQVGRSLDKLISGGGSFNDVMASVRENLLQIVTQLGVINPLLNGLFGSNKSTIADVPSGSGVLSDLFSGIGSLFSGTAGSARALGGPVQAGRAFLVGEQGPEIFTPNSNGNISAMRNAGSGSAVNVTISTPNPQSFRQSSGQISALLLDAVRRGQRLR
jgi:hypothetical protein